ncbi:MAG TPA: hypothetical protein VGE52_04670 [Pirellulales bacterium]
MRKATQGDTFPAPSLLTSPADQDRPPMLRFLTRRDLLRVVGCASLVVPATGCGTIFYPERRGQPATRVDWVVVTMDGLLLLCFLLPGIIAFVVDFSTGAIYLPLASETADAKAKYKELKLPKDQLTEEGIAAAVSKDLGKAISLKPNTYQTKTITSLDEFEATRREYAQLIG